MPNLLDWLTLALTPGLGPAGCTRLTEHLGDPVLALQAATADLLRIPGLTHPLALALSRREAQAEAEKELRAAERLGVTIITRDSPGYPDILRAIHQPPILLYVKGNPDSLLEPGIGIVGSRAASSYGKRVAEQLAGRLARQGLNIVSGLALGIDAAAHSGALAAGGGTIAVLGCGVDEVYPYQNRELHQRIPETGALVSEYPLGTRPDGFRFPARNRIISGLSLGILVVEAARRSGSLITARHALEQGREVFAVPGRVDSSKSAGAHRLLQEGAKLVQSVDDIIEELHHLLPADREAEPTGSTENRPPRTDRLSAEERKIHAMLDSYPRPVDEIIAASGLSAHKANEVLLLLEIKGLIETLPGGQYRKTTRLD